MHGCQTSYTNRAFNSLQFGIFTGFLKERLIFYDFFAQLKWSAHVYMLTAVSGLIGGLYLGDQLEF